MNSYFSSLDAIVQKRKISNRIRFMIQDVVDLRKSQWKPRRDDNAPKTIEQIHRDVHKEREDQERELNNPQFQGNMGPMGGMSRDGRMGDRRGDRGDDRNRKQSRKLKPLFFIPSLLFLSANDDKIDTVFVYDGLSSSTGLRRLLIILHIFLFQKWYRFVNISKLNFLNR